MDYYTRWETQEVAWGKKAEAWLLGGNTNKAKESTPQAYAIQHFLTNARSLSNKIEALEPTIVAQKPVKDCSTMIIKLKVELKVTS